MNRFRASYTVLNLWKSGNWEQAVKAYFKLDSFTTEAMAEGKMWHEKWRDHIVATKTMPIEFGGAPLKNPVCEIKKVVKLDEWLDLVYIMDMYDEPTIYDWKTGKESSESHISSGQLGIYAVGATLDGRYVEKGEIHRYDQQLKKSDMSIVWITDKLLKDSHNMIVTLAGEMHHYLETNKLYDKFGEHLAKANGTAVLEL